MYEEQETERQIAQADYRWAMVLHTACETLSHAAPYLLDAIDVSISLTDGAGQARTVEAWSRQLADIHGLRAAVEVDGDLLTVHFARDNNQGQER